MTHLKPDAKRPKRRKSDCRKGMHDFGAIQNIGAGIGRRVCGTCNAVTIDLTGAYEPAAPVIPGRVSSRRRLEP